MRKDRYNGYNDKAQQRGAHTFRGAKCDDCGLTVLKSEEIIIPKIMRGIPCADGLYREYDEEEMINEITSYLENVDSYISIRYNGETYSTQSLD